MSEALPQIDRKDITYVSLEKATMLPGEGVWDVMLDRWWSWEPGKGILFYKKMPQCNSNKNIAESVTRKCHPDAQVIFLKRVYIKHDCSDYL